MKKYILSCCLLCTGLYMQAQQKWTLRQCIDYAIEHNIEIKQQAVAVRNSEVDLSTSKNSRLPDLNAGVDQGFAFGQVIKSASNIASSGDLSTTSFSISSSIPLFTGFRITNEIKVNELNLLAATEGLKRAKEDTQLKVAALYLDVLFKKEILKVYKEQVSLSQSQVERTKLLVESGKSPMSQLYDIKAQLANDELNVTTADNDLVLSLLNLAQSLNLLENRGFDVEEPTLGDIIGENISSIIPPDQVFQMAVAERPHIKEAEYKLLSSQKGLKVAQAGYYPNLSFGMSYRTAFDKFLNSGIENPSISDQLSQNQRKSIGFTLSIPIFDRLLTRNKVRSARLNIENRELELDNVKLILFKEIQQAYQNATAAQAKYSSTEDAFIAADESFKYAKERYDIGKSTVFEFNDARTKLISSKSSQIQAKYDFLFRAKILDFYRGEPIDIK